MTWQICWQIKALKICERVKVMHYNFIVSQWGSWPPLQEDKNAAAFCDKALLASVPKMLKRRLTPLAKMVFCAANQCITENCPMSVVFSSTHGELAKSFAMMEMIEAGEDISPAAFSLSVHNAIAGLFSIAYNNTLASTVVAPGEEGIAAAFIEAIGLLEEGEDQVLLVFYDEPLVDFYPSAPFNLSSEESSAVALRITKYGTGIPLRMHYSEEQGNDGEQAVQIPLLIKFLSSNSQRLQLCSPRHSWCWEKR